MSPLANSTPSINICCLCEGSITSPATYKRGKRPAPKDDGERFDEEEWPLKEVIFVEDTRPVPIGEVLAVDGDQVSVEGLHIAPLAHEFRAKVHEPCLSSPVKR